MLNVPSYLTQLYSPSYTELKRIRLARSFLTYCTCKYKDKTEAEITWNHSRNLEQNEQERCRTLNMFYFIICSIVVTAVRDIWEVQTFHDWVWVMEAAFQFFWNILNVPAFEASFSTASAAPLLSPRHEKPEIGW